VKNESPKAEESAFKSVGGVGRIGKAFRYSMLGFGHAIRHEAAFRQELAFIMPFALIAIFLPLPLLEKIVLIALAALVLIVELLNSAVEAAIDRISLDRHPLSGRAKDMGSAAVFLSIAAFTVAWLLLAGPVVVRILFG
jgi:diacylglycerol kinase (ATP)